MQDNNNETVASAPAPATNTLMKDLMIPLSIVIAGLFIGAGLYFGGGPSLSATAPAIAPAVKADNTDKVNPVTADDHIKGNPDATVKIVEYSDFDCPFCSRHHDSMNTLLEKRGDDLAWVYRHLPLEQLHPEAASVAMASECVAELGGNDAFWNFTDGYFEARGNGNKTEHGTLIGNLIKGTGITADSFEECFESGRYLDDIQDDMDNATATGGRGTPWSIIIGPTGKTYPVNGAVPMSVIEQMIEVAKQEA